ncbi:MAG: hypothetical protein ACON5J_03030 [Rubripirellula sp.]
MKNEDETPPTGVMQIHFLQLPDWRFYPHMNQSKPSSWLRMSDVAWT